MAELPILFRQQMLALLPEEADALLQALQTEPSVAVRVNRRKAMPPATDDPVAWCRSGIYLDARRQFTFDPLLHSGCYYVQDASSMFISHVLSQVAGNSPVAYLDLCAAPGGKTTAAIDALPDGSLVVANEIDSRRAQILRENVVKWGYPHCVVTNSDASRLGKLHEAFDIVAADMPCSGEGMMRKDDEAVAQWTPALVEQCAARQREIASDIWQALKPGGIFIYSTCTFNRFEDEENARFACQLMGGELLEERHFLPGRDRGEGFYVAAIRKPVQPDSFSEALADVFAEARPSHIATSEQEAQEQLTRVKSLVRRFLRILYDAEKTYASAEPLPEVPLSYDEALQYLAVRPFVWKLHAGWSHSAIGVSLLGKASAWAIASTTSILWSGASAAVTPPPSRSSEGCPSFGNSIHPASKAV